MFDPSLQVWCDGTMVPLREAGISPLTHTLHYGSGAFEGIRAYETYEKETAIFRLEEHIDRLFYSCEKMFLTLPYSKEELMDACKRVVRENNLREAYLRPIAFHDDAALGVGTDTNKPSVLIAAWSWGKYLAADAVNVEVSDYRRISEKSFVCDAKISGHYVNSILATNVAKARGYHEALLLDHHDNIAEGPGENVFFIKGKELHTPKLGKILAGITRDSIITFAADLGYSVHEKDITLEDLNEYEGAFFTGTAAEVTPIESISQKGNELKVFTLEQAQGLQEYFFEIIRGKHETYQHWLAEV